MHGKQAHTRMANQTLHAHCCFILSRCVIVCVRNSIFSFFQDIEEECRSNLCGNGFNRWFDKSLTLPVYENGLAGGNVEHTTADATVGDSEEIFADYPVCAMPRVTFFSTLFV